MNRAMRAPPPSHSVGEPSVLQGATGPLPRIQVVWGPRCLVQTGRLHLIGRFWYANPRMARRPQWGIGPRPHIPTPRNNLAIRRRKTPRPLGARARPLSQNLIRPRVTQPFVIDPAPAGRITQRRRALRPMRRHRKLSRTRPVTPRRVGQPMG